LSKIKQEKAHVILASNIEGLEDVVNELTSDEMAAVIGKNDGGRVAEEVVEDVDVPVRGAVDLRGCP
jgi:hypothetical protein